MLIPELPAGHFVDRYVTWSPDGATAMLSVSTSPSRQDGNYLVQFGDGYPLPPIKLPPGLAKFSPSGRTVAIENDGAISAVDLDALPELSVAAVAVGTRSEGEFGSLGTTNSCS